MRKNWQEIRLEEALDYVQPTKFIVKSTAYDDSYKTPVLTPGKSFILGFTDETDGIYQNIPTIIFDDFTTEFKYVDFPFKVKSSAMKMLELKSAEYDIKFLYYLMQTLNFNSTEHKRYWISKYSKQRVNVPTLAEQKQIASILDAADSLRQKDQQLVEHYTALSQSLFLEIFGNPDDNPMGWEKTKLSQVCAIQGGYAFKSKDFVEGGVRLIKIANVNHEVIDWEEVDMLPISYLDKYSEYSLNVGDILMALTRPIIKSLGTVKAALVSEEDVPSLLNQRVARFFPNPNFLNNSYLLRIIYSSYFKNKIEKCASTSLQPNVSNKQVGAIEILVPPIDIQNQFAERIALIEKQKQQAQANLQKSEALFNSLLQRAFTGELTADKAA